MYRILTTKKVNQSDIISNLYDLDIQKIQYHSIREKLGREESQHAGWIEFKLKQLKLQYFIYLVAITTNFKRIIFYNSGSNWWSFNFCNTLQTNYNKIWTLNSKWLMYNMNHTLSINKIYMIFQPIFYSCEASPTSNYRQKKDKNHQDHT